MSSSSTGAVADALPNTMSGAPAQLRAKAPKRKKTVDLSIRYPFWFGGSASSFAACVTHPLDLGASTQP